MDIIKKFLKDEEGVTAIEYSLLAIGIALAIGVAAAALGDKIKNMFNPLIAFFE